MRRTFGLLLLIHILLLSVAQADPRGDLREQDLMPPRPIAC